MRDLDQEDIKRDLEYPRRVMDDKGNSQQGLEKHPGINTIQGEGFIGHYVCSTELWSYQ